MDNVINVSFTSPDLPEIAKAKRLLKYSHTEQAGTWNGIPVYTSYDTEGNPITSQRFLEVMLEVHGDVKMPD
jgi:hypothetical protein